MVRYDLFFPNLCAPVLVKAQICSMRLYIWNSVTYYYIHQS